MCIKEKGCCGTSLRKTCLVIAIVYLVYNIILFMLSALGKLSHSIIVPDYRYVIMVSENRTRLEGPGILDTTSSIFSIIAILICVFLILAAYFENKYLIIPWFIGYAATIVQIIIALTFLALRLKSIRDFKWPWDFLVYGYYTQSDFRDKMERSREIISNYSFWIIYESLAKLVIESLVLCYVISYYMELRKSDSQTESSNRRS